MLVIKSFIRGILDPEEAKLLAESLDSLTSLPQDASNRYHLTRIEKVLCERQEDPNGAD